MKKSMDWLIKIMIILALALLVSCASDDGNDDDDDDKTETSQTETVESTDTSSDTGSDTSTNTGTGEDADDTQGDVASGEKLYESQCQSCHGADGNGAALGPSLQASTCDVCGSYDALVLEINADMPSGNFASCVDECAKDTAAYIMATFTD